MEIITKTLYGIRSYNSIVRMGIPYVKFSLFGFTQWGDLNDSSVNEWRFLGYKIYGRN